MKWLRSLGLVACLAASLGLAAMAHASALALRSAQSDIDAHVVLPAPRAARILSLGYTELAADLTRIRALIYYGDGLVHQTGMPDVELLLRLINTLDPPFRRPYLWGAYATTFRRQIATADEYRSSVEVLRRGVAVFPQDWELNWLLGLRLYYDLKEGDLRRNREEGASFMERAMHAPNAPQDLAMIASAMRTELGQKERALRELREMILNTGDEKARKQLQRRYGFMVSDLEGKELVAEARRYDAAWKADLPYIPRTMYVLVGPPAKTAVHLTDLLSINWIDAGTDVAHERAP